MKQVAKVLISDSQGKYLLLQLNNHPVFLNDPDLPGGTVEEHESTKSAVIREVLEETGITLDPTEVKELYSSPELSNRGTEYFLYEVDLKAHPKVKLSWEHRAYEWLDKQVVIERTVNARDTYMRMVSSVLKLS